MADLDIHYDPIGITTGPVTVGITGLDDIKVDSKLAVTQPIDTSLTLSVPSPITTDSKLTYAFPDPIKTEAKAAIDLQPVVVDQCLRLSVGALPPTLVRLPNRQRVAFTLFGVEVLGFTLEGETKLVVQDLPRPGHVISLPPPNPPHDHHAHEHGGPEHRHPQQAHAGSAKKEPFVVRLGG